MTVVAMFVSIIICLHFCVFLICLILDEWQVLATCVYYAFFWVIIVKLKQPKSAAASTTCETCAINALLCITENALVVVLNKNTKMTNNSTFPISASSIYYFSILASITASFIVSQLYLACFYCSNHIVCLSVCLLVESYDDVTMQRPRMHIKEVTRLSYSDLM